MSNATRTLCVFLLLSLVCSCARDPVQSNAIATWTVDAKPLLEIATDDSVVTIGNANGVVRWHDGSVAVGDQSNASIMFYDSTGKFIKSVGRLGGGPGEFGMLGEVLHCGDSLYAHDFETRAFTLVSSDGNFGRRVSIVLPDSVRSTNSSVCNADGKFLTAGWDAEKEGTDKTGPSRGPIPFWLSDAAGGFVASLGTHMGPEKWTHVFPNGIVIVNQRPLGRETLIALGRSRAYIGTADSGTINVFALDGEVLPPLRIRHTETPITSADIDAYNNIDTIGLGPEGREQWKDLMKQMKYPATAPAYSALVVDNDENLWVRAFPAANATDVEWSVYRESGAPAASLRLPSNFAVKEVGADYIAGIDTDPVTGHRLVLILSLHRAK